MADPATIGRVAGLEAHLRRHIRGQDQVLPRIASALSRGILGLTSPDRPRASLFLVGPTGTGKSETFACATHYLLGPDSLVVFDMSEYQDRSAAAKLLGESRDDPGLLGLALVSKPEAGVLFDEVEKAHPLVFDLFLQILWRGQATLATGETVQFGRHFVGFTSNLGSAEAMRMHHSRFTSVEHAVLRVVERTLRPELVGRLDEKCVFARLDQRVQSEICNLEVAREISRLGQLGYDVQVSPEAMDLLLREGFHPLYGARPLRKTIERLVQNAIVESLKSRGFADGLLVPDGATPRLVIRSS